MERKRHSPYEIAAKLREAEELVRQGRRRAEIARALGVSMMTYHRWRKAQESLPPQRAVSDIPDTTFTRPTSVSALEQENLRLRRLVTDLLLKKVELEEQLQERELRRASA